jgi:hypothetical protein
VRIVAQNVAVLAGTRLAFVGIDDEVMRAGAHFLGHERPFETGRKTGAAAAAQAGGLHLFDDPVAALGEQILGAIPIAPGLRALQAEVMDAVEIGKDAIFIAQHLRPPSK